MQTYFITLRDTYYYLRLNLRYIKHRINLAGLKARSVNLEMRKPTANESSDTYPFLFLSFHPSQPAPGAADIARRRRRLLGYHRFNI